MKFSDEKLLDTIMSDYGISDEELFDQDFMLDSVVPGACKFCGAVTDSVEPDATKNWCECCGKNGVKSILTILGVV